MTMHWHAESFSTIALFQNNVEESGRLKGDEDHGHCGNSNLPQAFQTNPLLFYERFKAYQDYMLGN